MEQRKKLPTEHTLDTQFLTFNYSFLIYLIAILINLHLSSKGIEYKKRVANS
jgi:hypothetical protein